MIWKYANFRLGCLGLCCLDFFVCVFFGNASVVQRHGIPALFARPCECLIHKIALQPSGAFTASVLKVAVNHAAVLRPLPGMVYICHNYLADIYANLLMKPYA